MVSMDGLIHLRKFANDIIDEALDRLVVLGDARIWRFHQHLAPLEHNAVTKHFDGQFFVEIGVGPLRLLVAAALRDVCC